jgi:hypothetical protein
VRAASFNAKPQAPAQVQAQAPNFNERGRRLRLAVKRSGDLVVNILIVGSFAVTTGVVKGLPLCP